MTISESNYKNKSKIREIIFEAHIEGKLTIEEELEGKMAPSS